MEKRRIITYIIIWFILILVWFLFCYGKIKEAYYGWSSVQSFSVIEEAVPNQAVKKDTEKEDIKPIVSETISAQEKTEDTEDCNIRSFMMK